MQRACRCVGLARASFYRRPADKAKRDAPVVDVLNQIVSKHGRWGFELCFYWMRNHSYTWNHKRVWRVCVGCRPIASHLPQARTPSQASRILMTNSLPSLTCFKSPNPLSPTNTSTCSGAFKHDTQSNQLLALESVELGGARGEKLKLFPLHDKITFWMQVLILLKS